MFAYLEFLRRSSWYALGHYQASLLKPKNVAKLLRLGFRSPLDYLRRTDRLRALLGVDRRTLEVVFKEANKIAQYCMEAGRQHSGQSPYHVDPNFGPVLYAIVRILRPENVVETGVYSGFSSTFFLSAMEQNGAGRLHSIDLPPTGDNVTGWLVPEHLKKRWELTLGDANVELPLLLSRLGNTDIFFHDSDHSYEHMMWEFNLAYPYLNKGGFVISDDTNFNRAWDDFTQNHGKPSTRIYRIGVMEKAE